MAQPLIPPPELPVRSFTAPGHIESGFTERVDSSLADYSKLPRGTLYSSLPNADNETVAQHPNLKLLREIADPSGWPWVFRFWSDDITKITLRLGQENLTPAKYRRLIRTVETDTLVDADYDFPNGLTGDQTQIELAQETIEEARLKIIEEVIAIGADPLFGSEAGEFGLMRIYETVVNEGTEADVGFDVLTSKVEPFGNGKAVKITVKYPEDLAEKFLIERSLGQPNQTPEKYRRLVRTVKTDSIVDPLTYLFPNFLTGDQVQIKYVEETIFRARVSVLEEVIAIGADPITSSETGEFGILEILESVVNEGTEPDVGELIQNSKVTGLGNGKAIKITVQYPSNLFDLQKVKKSLGQPSLIPEKYRRLIRTVETEKPVPVDYDFPLGLTGDQTFIEFAQKTITEARLRILEEVINSSSDPLSGGETNEYGELIIYESIVNEGTAIDTGFLVLRSRTTPLGNGKAIKITVKYPEDLADIEIKDSVVDEKEGIVIAVARKIVTAGTAGGVDVDGTYREVRGQDIWRSIQIASKLDLDSLPGPVTRPGSRRIALPDVLKSISGIYGKNTTLSEGISGGANPGVTESVHAVLDGSILVKVTNGFRGMAKAAITRQFFNGVPSDGATPDPTIIKPSVGTIYLHTKGQGKSLSLQGGDTPNIHSSSEAIVRARSETIGPVLTGDLTDDLVIDSTTVTGTQIGLTAAASGLVDYEIDVSTPEIINSGDEITEESNVEKWRFNIYVLEFAIVTVP